MVIEKSKTMSGKNLKLIGRKQEQEQLASLRSSSKAELVVCTGRRRIGKSFLIRKVGQEWPLFLEIQGLAPAPRVTNKMQIAYFMKQLCDQLQLPPVTYKDWDSALRFLAKQIEGKACFVFLDEISWMGGKDHKFPGILKVLWDTVFSQNEQLTLVLCSSVSSWIEDNILSSTNFLGRISMQLNLEELSPNESSLFFPKRTSSSEVLKSLLLIGGVPKYLEEIKNFSSPTTGLSRSFLSKNGFLFNEYEKIFLDIFGSRHRTYAKIIETVLNAAKNFTEICESQKLPKNGKTSKLIHHLVLSGFLRKDQTWDLNMKGNKKSYIYRVSDNYLRFYFKVIKPLQKKINSDVLGIKSIDSLPNLNSMLGYQFENIIYKNIKPILKLAHIEEEELINWGSYIQEKTLRSEACQIDLLIQTKSTLYVFEIKYVPEVQKSVAEELINKVKKLKYPQNKYSIKTGIIYSHEIHPLLIQKRLIDYNISFKMIQTESFEY